VAFLAVAERFDGYFAGKARLALRRKRRRAAELGYTFARIDPLAELDPIRAINASLDVRQGRPIDPAYLDPAALRAYFSRSPETFGIRDAEEHLVAYLDLRTYGEVTVLSRFLGHGDALEKGVM
jgi:hypothetical protein